MPVEMKMDGFSESTEILLYPIYIYDNPIYIYVYMLPKQGYWISKSFTIIYLKIESYIQLKTHTHM